MSLESFVIRAAMASLFAVTFMFASNHFAVARDPKESKLDAALDKAAKNTSGSYDEVLRRNPRDYIVLYRVGKRKVGENDLKGAMANFALSLKYNPLQSDTVTAKTTNTQRTLRAWVYQDMGFVYCRQNKLKEAAAALSHAIALRPHYYCNFQNRAIVYKKLGKLDLARADQLEANYLRQADLPDNCELAPISLE